jgi:Protein of unknown function (DUF3592)
MSEARPYLLVPLLLAGIVYTAYWSAPQFGLQHVTGKIASSTCFGNQAPYGCSVEVEYYYDKAATKASFTGSYQRKYETFDTIDLWVNPKDPTQVLLEVGWSRSGLFLCGIFAFALLIYGMSFLKINLNSERTA